ncbi:MAG: NADH-quinone oxidoreductase subunit C [Pseudomonadota bacterium]
MNEYTQKIAKALSNLPVQVTETDYRTKGFHALLVVESSDRIKDVVQVLFNHDYFIGFVTACHTTPAIQMLYQFARYDVNHRIMIQCPVDENNQVPTIGHIFQGAQWHERETRDFFGVTFIGHPNMEPFILDVSDRDLKPLLKNEQTLKSVETIFGQGDQHDE